MDDSQLILRRVYDDAGKLLREDKAPKDLKNDRSVLMAYWTERDRLKAEAEAEAARAEAERVAALDQNPAEAEGALALVSLQQQIDELKPLVADLQDLALATPEAVTRGAAQIARVAGLGAEIEAVALEAAIRIDKVAEGADKRLSELDGQLRSVVNTAGTVVRDCRLMVEKNSSAMLAKVSEAIAKRITALEVQAAQLRGPKGAQGNPGVCVTIGAGVPKDASVFESLIGRGAIPGDIYIDGSDENRYAYRWSGSAFEKGPAMSGPTKLIDAKITSLDASTKVFPTVSTAVGGGSGGSGIVVPIAPSVVTKNASVPFIDTSRFQAGGFDSFTSGIIMLELTPTTGSFAGNRSSLAGAFQLLAGTPDPFLYTEFASLGNIFNGAPPMVDVQFNGQLGPAVAPSSLGVSVPPGSKLATTLFLTINSSASNHTTFLLRGDVIFNQDPASIPVAANALIPKQPAWNLI